MAKNELSQEEKDAKEQEIADAEKKGGGESKPGSGSSGKFEQEDIDRFTGKARKEGRTVGQTETLKALGFEGTEEEAIEYLTKIREVEDAEKSDMEKLIAKVDGLEERAKDAETALDVEKSSSLTTRLKSAVMLEVVSNSELKVHPDALDDIWIALSSEYLGDDGIHIDENGKILGVTKSIESLLKVKPYFASTSDEENPGSNTRQPRETVGNPGENIEDKLKYGKSILRTRL